MKDIITNASISFEVQPFEGTIVVTPVVDGTPLPDIIETFEREMQYEPAGGYGGLIPGWFKYGPLDQYFLGNFEKDGYFEKMGRAYILGCKCGEVGCWPLLARISSVGQSVVWDRFEQPHRKERNYSALGLLTFNAERYLQAVAVLKSVNL